MAMKTALLRWISANAVSVRAFDAEDIPIMTEWIQRYSERREMDFADATLVWLALRSACDRIMTTDVRDFSRYRIDGTRRFEIV